MKIDQRLAFQIETNTTIGKWFTAELKPCAETTLPPLVVCSFDIEAYSKTHEFPDPSRPDDAVTHIGMVVQRYGETAPLARIVLCNCEEVKAEEDGGAVFVACRTEAGTLKEFVRTLAKFDVDVVIGYNIYGFDNAFLWKRFETVCPFSGFQVQGKGGRTATYRMKDLNSSAKGQNRFHFIQRHGMFEIDLWKEIKENHKLDSYVGLCFQALLGGENNNGKIDLSPQEMFRLFELGDAASMATVARYCVRDCELPLRLLFKLSLLENANEMAVVCGGTRIEDIFTRGQQVKAYNLICRFCLKKGFLVNERPEIRKPDSYVGATVLKPKPGFHTTPIATLDFASLYPSIIRANNLCYSTLCLARAPANSKTYEAGGKSHSFVDPSLRKGILPEILEQLLRQRKVAKKAMKAAKDPSRSPSRTGGNWPSRLRRTPSTGSPA